MRKLILVAAVVAALGGAGVAGAIGEGTVTIGQGQWARARTSSIYCHAFTDNHTGKPAFGCGKWAGNIHVGGSYSAVVDQFGVDVYHWDASGRNYRKLRTYLSR